LNKNRKNIKTLVKPGSKFYRYKTQLYYKLSEHILSSRIDTRKINFYFIISTGRTGTRSLAKFLNHFSENYALHEPLPNLLKEGNDYARNLIDSSQIKDKFIAARQYHFKKLVNNPSIVNYIESNNRLYSFIEPLRELYKGAKFIHVVRDGRDVVRSGVSRNFYTTKDKAYRIRANHFPDDPYYDKWRDMDQFQKVCWWWLKKEQLIYDATHDYNDSIMIKFNDLFDSKRNYPGLKKILNFLDFSEINDEEINRFLKKENSTKKFKFDHWSNWDKQTNKKFETIAGKHMLRLGYEL